MATGGNINDVETEIADNEADITEVQEPLENFTDEPQPLQEATDQSCKFQTNKVSILLIGETGAGKSTLINSLLGGTIDKRAKVTHGLHSTPHEKIEKHTGKIGYSDVVVYDTRGLASEAGRSSTKDLLKAFQKHIQDDEIDLVLICNDMTKKFNESTVQTTKLLVEYFGKHRVDIWLRCIFVLTKADAFDFDDDDDDDGSTDYDKMLKIMQDWGHKIRECLQKYGVPEHVALDMPVCVSGKRKNLKLPVTQNWMVELIKWCKKRCSPEARQAILAIEETLKGAIFVSKAGSAVAGAVVGAAIIPGLGAIPGFTIGYLIGIPIGKHVGRKAVKKMVEQKTCNKKKSHDLS